jgi:ABC-2 type transport system ATP-binding protein
MLIEIANLTVYGRPSLPEKQGNLWKRTSGLLKRRLCFKACPASLLKRITCSFPCGISMILGPNGAGKSTLLQVLDGLILPDVGRILIDGQVAKPPVLRQNIGYLPQTFGFYPKLTAREMLDYIALLKGIVDHEIREINVENALRRMGLLTVADRKMGVYSRGIRQKVGIAQTLLGNPPVLILDEPTAGLDPEARNKLRGMLAEIGQNQVIIWASSIIADVYCADRVLVLEQGKKRFWGISAELAAYAKSLKNSSLLTKEGMDDEHWSCMLEQGYREILSNREDQ